ncbi:hypothetical protein FPV67DRAFT_113351 [Lyophyllum atratum]|nr:hypothetical protein FPV67DRAFT_113351 [Lyophyllum atratum]
MHPRSLLIDLSKTNTDGDASAGAERKGAPSPKLVDDIVTLIPDVILTSPTPDLSKASPVFTQYEPGTVLSRQIGQTPGLAPYPHLRHAFEEYQGLRGPHVISASGPNGLGLQVPLGVAVDEMGTMLPRPHGAHDRVGLVMDQGYAYTSRAALFRAGMDRSGRGRRAWDALSNFFSKGRRRLTAVTVTVAVAVSTSATTAGPEDNANTPGVVGRRQGLDLSLGSGRRRWFRSPRHVHGSAASRS